MNAVFSKIRISSGTASLLGLSRAKIFVNPETAYILVGNKCTGGCAFCSQNNSSEKLSRVVWPEYDLDVFFKTIKMKFPFKNVCIQVTKNKNSLEHALYVLKKIRKLIDKEINISVSADFIDDTDMIDVFFNNGMSRLGIAVDCVSPDKYSIIKKGDYQKKIDFLLKINKKYAGKISTHAIAGLGETACEMMFFLDKMIKNKIQVALFAFTPMKNKKSEFLNDEGPDIKYYRLIQACFYLLKKKFVTFNDIIFDLKGNITTVNLQFKLSLKDVLDGVFLKTTGCKNCNRPFYNEKVNSIWYNYPRIPENFEVDKEIKLIEKYFDIKK